MASLNTDPRKPQNLDSNTHGRSRVHSIESKCGVCNDELGKTKELQGLNWVINKLQRIVKKITFRKNKGITGT